MFYFSLGPLPPSFASVASLLLTTLSHLLVYIFAGLNSFSRILLFGQNVFVEYIVRVI